METKIAPAVIQVLDGKYCDGAGNEITNTTVLDTFAMFLDNKGDELPPYVFQGADLGKLDADLKLISLGQLDVQLPEDTYDYSAHQWETPKGKLIGEVFAECDAECDRQQAMWDAYKRGDEIQL